MKNTKRAVAIFTSLLSLFESSFVAAQSKRTLVDRPPQFVLLAFDGSRENNFWQESRNFSMQLENELSAPVKFTYFISGVYWLTQENRKVYQGPYRAPGRSDIDFGQTQTELIKRIDHVNAAYEEGHEIASHANGHFDASDFANRRNSDFKPWNEQDWSHEFQQFNNLIFGAFQNNRIRNHTNYSTGYAFSQKDITGFRAPVLGVTQGLWPTLAKFGFRYDTSKVNNAWYWPTKDSYGTWQFPLAEIALVGTAKKTLSMDYNFYVQQSRGVRDEANKELYRKQMIDSYAKYFNDNYYGRRAPIHIGHHFSRWNGGAYWEAMKTFARNVCGQPEVKCVTYADYANWLDSLNTETLNAYRNGQFIKMTKPLDKLAENLKVYDAAITIASTDHSLIAQTDGISFKKERLNIHFEIDGTLFSRDRIALKDLRKHFQTGTTVDISAVVMNAKGQEVNRATHTLHSVGTDFEYLSPEPREGRALLGDLPEAHLPDEEI